jgi:ATP-dependent Clp protease adaptor protein ClpS
MKFYWEEDTETDVLIEDDTDIDQEWRIIVWNDEVNTFDWVIDCFMDILQHTHVQAEQLALIIHTKGKATVKTGPLQELKPRAEALCERGLSAEISD